MKQTNTRAFFANDYSTKNVSENKTVRNFAKLLIAFVSNGKSKCENYERQRCQGPHWLFSN